MPIIALNFLATKKIFHHFRISAPFHFYPFFKKLRVSAILKVRDLAPLRGVRGSRPLKRPSEVAQCSWKMGVAHAFWGHFSLFWWGIMDKEVVYRIGIVCLHCWSDVSLLRNSIEGNCPSPYAVIADPLNPYEACRALHWLSSVYASQRVKQFSWCFKYLLCRWPKTHLRNWGCYSSEKCGK